MRVIRGWWARWIAVACVAGTAACNGITGIGKFDVQESSVPATDLLALMDECEDNQVSTEDLKNDYDEPNAPLDVPVCAVDGKAVYWHAGMTIACDGSSDPERCPPESPHTAILDSGGRPLDPIELPFIVVPNNRCDDPNQRAPFDHEKVDIRKGAAVAVIYKNRLVYGVFGDIGMCDSIGRASYAMAEALGIDSGGVPSGVTYFVFRGPGAVVSPVEDREAAMEVGDRLAGELVAGRP